MVNKKGRQIERPDKTYSFMPKIMPFSAVPCR